MTSDARNARLVGLVGLAIALGLPLVLFGEVIGRIAAAFRLEFEYLVGAWTPWVLLGLGVAFFVPVALSAGRDPESRWYPRARNAYLGWGITLYLLGFALATQVSQVVRL